MTLQASILYIRSFSPGKNMILPYIEDIEPQAQTEKGVDILKNPGLEFDRLRSEPVLYDPFEMKYVEFKEKIEKERFARELLARGA